MASDLAVETVQVMDAMQAVGAIIDSLPPSVHREAHRPRTAAEGNLPSVSHTAEHTASIAAAACSLCLANLQLMLPSV